MSGRIVRANGVDLCVETFGDAGDPTVLLIHGACASMLWWPEELCRSLAACGRHVVRYDSRDTGRSTSFPAGRPPYALSDLADDAVGVLDALGVRSAHVVGRSLGVGVAVVAAVDHPERVRTLTLVGGTTDDPGLPPPTPEFLARPEPEDPVEAIVAIVLAYAGPGGDEAAVRAVAEADVARTRDVDAAMTNHFAMEIDGPRRGGIGDITAPTLVVHGDADPVFPLPHGEALAAAVPGARLLVLPGVGHDLPPTVTVLDALLTHTRPTLESRRPVR